MNCHSRRSTFCPPKIVIPKAIYSVFEASEPVNIAGMKQLEVETFVRVETGTLFLYFMQTQVSFNGVDWLPSFSLPFFIGSIPPAGARNITPYAVWRGSSPTAGLIRFLPQPGWSGPAGTLELEVKLHVRE